MRSPAQWGALIALAVLVPPPLTTPTTGNPSAAGSNSNSTSGTNAEGDDHSIRGDGSAVGGGSIVDSMPTLATTATAAASSFSTRKALRSLSAAAATAAPSTSSPTSSSSSSLLSSLGNVASVGGGGVVKGPGSFPSSATSMYYLGTVLCALWAVTFFAPATLPALSGLLSSCVPKHLKPASAASVSNRSICPIHTTIPIYQSPYCFTLR